MYVYSENITISIVAYIKLIGYALLYFRHNAFDLDDAVARKNQKFANNHGSNNNCFGKGNSGKSNGRLAAAQGKSVI